MEHDDREYTDMLNEGLKDVEPGAELHGTVRDGIARNVVHVRHRNTALGAVAIAIVLTMALSTVTPVFGRNGTLPQVITAMAAERQAQKMTRTLGTATVQQTGAALLVPEATVQTVADSALSETDSILALVIADRAGRPVGEVVALRSQGHGWGVIMARLGISGHDISEAVDQAQTVATANTPSTSSQSNSTSNQPAVSNRDGDKIVVNGQITAIAIVPGSPMSIKVEGKPFTIVEGTQIKYHGKAITPSKIQTKLLAGKLYATVQGTKQPNTAPPLANLIIVQDGASSDQATPSNEQATPSSEQTNPSNELTNPSNELTNPSNERAAASNEQQVRGKVEVGTVTPTTGILTTLRIDGFDHDIILNADTKVEQVGAGSVDLSAIEEGQTVQVHVRLSDGAYLAQQVHIEDKSADDEEEPTDSSVTTWKGTIAAIDPDAKSITLTGVNPPFVFHIVATSVLQDASHHRLTIAQLFGLPNPTTQKVTIQGKLLAGGTTVDIVKLTVTTVNTTTTPKPTNPGKGNGKQ